MGHDRCAPKQERTAACAHALATMFLLAACIGCGVRTDQILSHAPLPICDNTGATACQTLENRASFAAPSWLVRCRREWTHWRHGHGAPVEREAIVIPPAPRFHPVPTRPVFVPLEYETPAGAEMTEPQPPAPVPPKPKMQFPAEEIPGPSNAATPDKLPESKPSKPTAVEPKDPLQPQLQSPPQPSSPPSSEASAMAPKLLPRVLMPKASPQLSLTPPIRTAARSKPQISKIPDAPLATEPLAESTPSPDWKPRR